MTYDKSTIEYVSLPTRKKFYNLTGQRFGRLVILGYAGKVRRSYKWWAECDCGTISRPDQARLLGGDSTSCGCFRRENARQAHTTHGQSKTAMYKLYVSVKNRCTNPNDTAYERYAGRGIKFRFTSFEQFFATLGPKPSPGLTVERIDNNGHYEPGNVKWATSKEQGRNKRNNRLITVNGITKASSEWAESLGLSRGAVHMRMDRGWCDPCAVSLPKSGRCKHH